MEWIIVIGIILAVLILLAGISKQEIKPAPSPYELKASVFTPAERSFFGVLEKAVSGNAKIFAKIRVADIITTKKGLNPSERQTAFNRISAKHFDFILCAPDDLYPRCVLELNDASHNSENSKKRDAFLLETCDAVGLPLILFSAKARYTILDIQETLSPYLDFQKPSPVKAPDSRFEPKKNSDSPDSKYAPKELVRDLPQENGQFCPKCHSPLVRRTAKKGKYAGKPFLACKAYPHCRYMKALDA